MKIDTHVHSIYSNRRISYLFERYNARESYTTPRAIYDTCLNRGMDLVTITDHNTIEGALEIADLPHTFLSEEITSFFPEDGLAVHVTALDINEAEHREIQRLGGNIFELAAYLRGALIPHYVSHPLSHVNKPLTPAHVQQLLLLFKHLEGRNGSRDELAAAALLRLVRGLTREKLAEWAERHHLEPVDQDPTRYLIGGSDDHGRLNLARAYTEFQTSARTTAAMREDFFAGAFSPRGQCGTPDSVSHNVYALVFQYFQHNSTQSAFSDILNFTDADEELEPGSVTYKDRRAAIAHAIKDAVETFPGFSPFDIIETSHTPEAHEAIAKLARRIINNLFQRFVGGLVESFEQINIERAFDNIPGVFTAGSVVLPYLFGYRHLVTDREECEQLVADLGFGYNTERRPKVAIFTDTGFQLNGVSIGLRRLVARLRELGHDIDLVISAPRPADHEPGHLERQGGLVVFEPISAFSLPVYQEVHMGLPSIVDVVNYLSRERVAVVQLSTPGPLGVVGLIAARLLGLKVVANYHTELADYALKITRDENISKATWYWTRFFYKQMARVIAPSAATVESLVRHEVDRNVITVLPRGIDAEAYHPGKRDRTCWRTYGLGEKPKVLYVGRVSKEKGLDVLFDAFAILRQQRVNADLVIVGEGPYYAELSARYLTTPGVSFLGYRYAEELTRIYASADIFAFPSATDTFGNVVIEAQASGLPVVVVDQGGPAEQVRHGETGLIVPAENPEAMAEAIASLLANPKQRAAIAKAGRKRAQGMSLDTAANAHWDFYMSVWGKERVHEPSCPVGR